MTSKLSEKYKIITEEKSIFENVKPYAVNEWFRQGLEFAADQDVSKKKNKNTYQFLTIPFLKEVWDKKSALTLKREPGFEFEGKTLSPEFTVCTTMPENENEILDTHLFILQCGRDKLKKRLAEAAEYALAVRSLYNDSKTVYGIVTSGEEWQFVCLKENTFSTDTEVHHVDIPEMLLGKLSFLMHDFEAKAQKVHEKYKPEESEKPQDEN